MASRSTLILASVTAALLAACSAPVESASTATSELQLAPDTDLVRAPGAPRIAPELSHVTNLVGGPPGRGECTPGAIADNPCPRCGVRRRECFADGSWSDWGRCTDQKECELGDKLAVACEDDTRTERRCTSTCQWGQLEAVCPGVAP